MPPGGHRAKLKAMRSVLAWRPGWSRAAGLRTLRAVLVIPALFALTFKGLGNPQLALFAVFGGLPAWSSPRSAAAGGTRSWRISGWR